MQELLIEMREARKATARETAEFKDLLTTQQETIEGLKADLETVQRDTLGSGSEASSNRSGDLHHLIKERALMETSRGQWMSHLLEGNTLPEDWPLYEWMKHWSGRMTVVRALLALKELQKNKTLLEAVREMKTSTNKLGRNLTQADHRLLAPVLKEQKTEYEHDVWEMCLLGVADLPYFIPSWLYICRTVKPVLVEGTSQWNAIIAGGVWPYSCSEGFKIGKFKERVHFAPFNRTEQEAGGTPDQGAEAPKKQGELKRPRRFGRGGWSSGNF